jgi:hypothetical protein
VASDGSPRGLGQASRLSNRPLDIYPWAENRPVTDFELTHDR